MAVILDMIGAMMLMGTLLISILGININLTTENAKTTVEFHSQTEIIQLGRIIEFDLNKIGYDVPSTTRKIVTADTARLKFKTNLWDAPGKVDSVEYILGGFVSYSSNPRDRVLTRYENTTGVLINYSITNFRLTYYNEGDIQLASPVTGNNLDSIRSIKIYLTLESPTPLGDDSTYASGYYSKLVYPRNLQ
jgi:hypothetical protein